MDYGIKFEKYIDAKLVGYCDNDQGGCKDDMKSTSAYVFSLGSGCFHGLKKNNKQLLNHRQKKKYVLASLATPHSICLRRIFKDFDEKQKEGIEIFCDNKLAI